MSKLRSFLPTVAGLIACTLSMIGLFAGTRRDFETGCEFLTLFTPNIGNAAGINGFYTIYTMSYCEGYMWPDGRGRNITECFDRTIPFSFDPTEILQSVSQSDMSLSRIWWPDVITGDFRAFALTNRVMTVLYCIGVGVAGAGVLARIGLAIAGARRQSMVEGLLFLVSFISLAIASIIASAMSSEFVELINYHGKESGVTARYGQKFLGMTWSATALLLAGSILSLLAYMAGRGRSGTGPTGPPPAPKEEAAKP